MVIALALMQQLYSTHSRSCQYTAGPRVGLVGLHGIHSTLYISSQPLNGLAFSILHVYFAIYSSLSRLLSNISILFHPYTLLTPLCLLYG